MKLKARAADFRVRELLAPDILTKSGEFRVYRVIKRKLTSLEAAEVLAQESGRGAGEISMCGLKDRQGVTTQYMALRHGPEVRTSGSDLKIESVGFARQKLDSKSSEGNAFEIVARGLTQEDVSALRANLARVRKHGLINYFDDQRFGNLRHGQGWIALELMRGETEKALKKLLAARSLHDDPRTKVLKQALWDQWGDWSACRDIAGKLGQHHSVFEHLRRHPEDFAGGFFHVASRVRLIHLYAYQSHVWNRAVADFVREHMPVAKRVVLDSEEGPLVYPDERELLPVPDGAVFRLPGPGLEDVVDPAQRAFLADVLAADRLAPAQFRIDGISGFQLKGEDRPLFVIPAHLRVRPPKPDPLNRGSFMLGVRFELPRGAYATLVMRRLFELPGRTPAAAPQQEYVESERWPRQSPRDDRSAPPRRYDRDDRRAPPRRYDRDDRSAPPRRYDRDDRRGPPPRFNRDGRSAPPRRYDRDDRSAPPRRERGSGEFRPAPRDAGPRGGRKFGPKPDSKRPGKRRSAPPETPRPPKEEGSTDE